MHPHVRSLVILTFVAGGVLACAVSDAPVAPMKVTGPPLLSYGRIKATDSLLDLTDVAYLDTSLVLVRSTPLAEDVSVSATIGPKGGELRNAAAGVTVTFPPGAVRTTTTITMTAFAGDVVAYDFQPHLQFYVPVVLQQDLRVTTADVGALPRSLYGGYYGTSLDSSFVDTRRRKARVRETQLGYVDRQRKLLRIFVGHFSGYFLMSG